MKQLLTVLALGTMLSFGTAHAQEKAKTPQQEKMAMCNQQAEGKKQPAGQIADGDAGPNRPAARKASYRH